MYYCGAEWNREEKEKEVEVDFTLEQLNHGKRFYGSILRQGSNTENKKKYTSSWDVTH